MPRSKFCFRPMPSKVATTSTSGASICGSSDLALPPLAACHQ
jgi:hypothetical protein